MFQFEGLFLTNHTFSFHLFTGFEKYIRKNGKDKVKLCDEKVG